MPDLQAAQKYKNAMAIKVPSVSVVASLFC